MNDLYLVDRIGPTIGLARVQVLYVIFVIEVPAQHHYDNSDTPANRALPK